MLRTPTNTTFFHVFPTTTKSFKNNRPPFQGRRINRLTLFLVPAPVRGPSCCVILKGVGGLFPGGVGVGGNNVHLPDFFDSSFLGIDLRLIALLLHGPRFCYVVAFFPLWVAMLMLLSSPFHRGFVTLMLCCGFLVAVGLLCLCYVVASFLLWGCYAYATLWRPFHWVCYAYATLWLVFS